MQPLIPTEGRCFPSPELISLKPIEQQIPYFVLLTMTVDTLASLTPAALSSPKTGLQIPDEEVSTGLLGTKSESQHVELSVTVTADDCVNLEPAGKANEAAEKDVLEEKLQNLRFSPQILKNGLSMLGLNSEGQQTFLRMSLPVRCRSNKVSALGLTSDRMRVSER